MKKLLFSLLLFFLASHISAQETILFQEDFDDNRNAWELRISKKVGAVIEGGYFHLKGKSEFSPNFFVQSLPMRMDQDFDMELGITQISGAKNMGFGLVWGAKADQQDLSAFLISTNGQYTILRKEQGQYSEIKPWTESKIINRSGKPNIIRIQKRGEKIRYLLNGKVVFHSAAPIARSQHAGILFHGTMKLEADYFRVWSVDQPARGNQ